MQCLWIPAAGRVGAVSVSGPRWEDHLIDGVESRKADAKAASTRTAWRSYHSWCLPPQPSVHLVNAAGCISRAFARVRTSETRTSMKGIMHPGNASSGGN